MLSVGTRGFSLEVESVFLRKKCFSLDISEIFRGFSLEILLKFRRKTPFRLLTSNKKTLHSNFSDSKSEVLTQLKAAEIMEEQIDSEMKKMDELDDDDIEKIRQRRLKAMQKAHQAKQVIF